MPRTAPVLFAFLVTGLAPAGAAGQDEPPPVAYDLRDELSEGGLPLTVDEAVERALATDASVDVAEASVQGAEARARASRTGWSPHLELGARYNRVGGFEDGSVQVPGSMQEIVFRVPRDRMRVGAEVVVPLSDWFTSVLPTVRAAEVRVRVEEIGVEAARSDIALAVRQAYYRYVQARGDLAVARASEQQAAAHGDRIGALARAGLATEADRLEASARHAATRAALNEVQGDVESEAAELEALLNLRAERGFAIPQQAFTHPPPPAPARDALMARAQKERAEIRAMKAMIASQEHRGRAARLAQLPKLAATAGYDYANPNPFVVPPQDRFDSSWQVGLALTWSPDEAVRSRSRADELAAERARLRAELARLQDRVRVQVARARARYAAARASLQSAQAAAEAAEDTFRARVAELRAGRAVATEVLDAEADLARARRVQIGAIVGTHQAWAQLAHAVGRTPTGTGAP